MTSQYATDANLAARQRLWWVSRREPSFDLYHWVVDATPVGHGGRVLDVGCGNGPYLPLLEHPVGVDSSLGMLGAARARAVTVPLVQADVQLLPFAPESFDCVLAAHMLYHAADRERAAAEMQRVLRPGGACVVVTNSSSNHAELVSLVESVVGAPWTWRRPSDVAFSMENGAAPLRSAFAHVEPVWAPTTTVYVTDADALADYVASVADLYQPQVDVPWATVVDEARARVQAAIARDGAFPITTRLGAFVCRRTT